MRSSRREDIHNRYSLAMAERQIYEPGDRYYKQLSEVMRVILTEYQVQDGRGTRNRYGFRLRGTDYKLVTLDKNEKY